MMKIFPFLFVLVFYFLTFVLRSFLLWKRTGINPMTFDKSDDAHGFNGKLFKFIAAFEILVIGVYSFGGDLYDYLLPFWYIDHSVFMIIGWLFLVAALLWVFIAQVQMSNSWRIGIDTKHKTDLITGGLFSISRNPIFLGILMADLGLFFVIPNAFTMLIAVWSYSVIQTQVRLEEDFLKGEHGVDYEECCGEVRRWI